MQFTSTDLELVESTWQQFVPSSSLQKADPRRFRFDWRSEDLGAAVLVDYRLAAQVHSAAAPEDQILVCRVDAPDARVWSDREVVDPRSPWISDGTRVEAKWDHAACVRAFIFDRQAAEAVARRMTGDDALVLRTTGLVPHDAGAARQWEAMFGYADQMLGAGEAGAVLTAEVERHALMITLSAFPTTFSESLHRPAQRTGAPVTVRRALSYIDANAHRAITIDDVAGASYISTRGLQYAFRRALDITPAEALRRARLDGARRDLQAGRGGSVGEIARRWGFSNSSRFSVTYRETFGQSPSLPSR